MKPKLSLVTLGVRDLDRSIHFYRDGLGWPLAAGSVAGAIAFFELGERCMLALFGRAALAADAGLADDGAGAAFAGFTLAHNEPSPAAVDAAIGQAVAAGARLVKPAAATHWGGYSGYFADPDGVLWEVAHNPFMDLT